MPPGCLPPLRAVACLGLGLIRTPCQQPCQGVPIRAASLRCVNVWGAGWYKYCCCNQAIHLMGGHRWSQAEVSADLWHFPDARQAAKAAEPAVQILGLMADRPHTSEV